MEKGSNTDMDVPVEFQDENIMNMTIPGLPIYRFGECTRKPDASLHLDAGIKSSSAGGSVSTGTNSVQIGIMPCATFRIVSFQ
jgi:uncharacterized Zn-binding protein involved in type VI secretion